MLKLSRNVCFFCTKRAPLVSKFARLNIKRDYAGNYVPLVQQMNRYGKKTALIDQNGEFSYNYILGMSTTLGKEIKETLRNYGKPMVHNNVQCGPRIAFLCPNDVQFSVMVCAIWQMGGITVPLCKSHPLSELEYVVSDSQAAAVLSTPEYSNLSQALAKSLNIEHITVGCPSAGTAPPIDGAAETRTVPEPSDDSGAMILYTSGTTGRPKGVLMTHSGIRWN